MTTANHDLEIRELALTACESDPALLAAVLQTADQLLEVGELQQAAAVLRRLAGRLTPPSSRCSSERREPEPPDATEASHSSTELPPVVRCHLFSRLGCVLAQGGEFDEAEEWLRLAVALAEESRLTDLSRRDFQRTLERIRDRRPKRAEECRNQETAVASAGETATLLRPMPETERKQWALAKVTQELQPLVELRFIKGLGAEVVAQILGWTVEEVLARLPNAREQFHRALTDSRKIAAESHLAPVEPTASHTVRPK